MGDYEPTWHGRVAVLLAAVLVLVLSARAMAQATSPADAGQQTRVVVAGEQYGSPPGGTFFLGHDYRDLWTTPIRVEVLDLHATAGGLQPVMRVGGQVSQGLALRGADGRDYTFRSVNKVASASVLPVEFRDSVLLDIVQDQFAATVPGVQVVQPRMAAAVGVLGVGRARLVVLPDDVSLGEFREDFAGVLGVFLEGRDLLRRQQLTGVVTRESATFAWIRRVHRRNAARKTRLDGGLLKRCHFGL